MTTLFWKLIPKSPSRLFVSYSRADQKVVLAVTQLFRVTGCDVFVDSEDIDPGEKWEDRLKSSLEKANRVLVFWSRNAMESVWVREECTQARRKSKKVVPLLLDSTPLNEMLSPFQAFDLRPILDSLAGAGESGGSEDSDFHTDLGPSFADDLEFSERLAVVEAEDRATPTDSRANGGGQRQAFRKRFRSTAEHDVLRKHLTAIFSALAL